jgi:hypothetical protein
MGPGFSSIYLLSRWSPSPPPPRFSTDIWTDSQTGRDTPTSNRAEHKQERRPSFTSEENSAFHLRKNPRFIREHPLLSGKIFNLSSLTVQKSFSFCIIRAPSRLVEGYLSLPLGMEELPHCSGEFPSLHVGTPSLYERVPLSVWEISLTAWESFPFWWDISSVTTQKSWPSF